MIYSKHLNLAYCPIPKNACSSVKHALLAELKIDLAGQLLHDRLPTPGNWQVEPGELRRLPDSPTPSVHRLPGAFAFAVVRHPLDRLVSAFADKVLHGAPGLTPDWYALRHFPDFVHRIVSTPPEALNEHMRPQSCFLGRLPFDGFLRFERLQEDWRLVQERTGCKQPLVKRNASKHQAYRDYFDDALAREAAGYYAEDFRRLGYPNEWR